MIKRKLSLSTFKYAQLNRQFELIKESNARCKVNFPDCFHHKLRLVQECKDLRAKLIGGRDLLKTLTTGKQKIILKSHNKNVLRAHNQALGYLITKLDEVIKDVEKIQSKGNEGVQNG